jgi:hypothetical protein
MTLAITCDEVALSLDVRIRHEIRTAAKTELPHDLDPADLGLLSGDSGTVAGTALPRGCSSGSQSLPDKDRNEVRRSSSGGKDDRPNPPAC